MPAAPNTPAVACRVHTDGAARGNPGPAAVGVVIDAADGTLRAEFSRCVGSMTNNRAEYFAVLAGCDLVSQLGFQAARFYLDSELVVKQLCGVYRIRDAELAILHAKVVAIAARIGRVSFEHVPRERNRRADELANLALDGKPVSFVSGVLPTDSPGSYR